MWDCTSWCLITSSRQEVLPEWMVKCLSCARIVEVELYLLVRPFQKALVSAVHAASAMRLATGDQIVRPLVVMRIVMAVFLLSRRDGRGDRAAEPGCREKLGDNSFAPVSRRG